MRKTRRTIRRATPIARDVMRAANDADKLSRSLHRLADRIGAAEVDAQALQAYMASGYAEEDSASEDDR